MSEQRQPYTNEQVRQFGRALSRTSMVFSIGGDTRTILRVLDREGIRVTFPEPRFHVASFKSRLATVFEKDNGPRADFYGPDADQYARQHAAHLNEKEG